MFRQSSIVNRQSKNILWFDQIGKKDLIEVGGKGANLGELIKAKIPIPHGFVVTSNAYFTFLKKNKLDKKIQQILGNINPEDTKKLQKASLVLQKFVLSSPISQNLANEVEDAYRQLYSNSSNIFVAVRSSASSEDSPGTSFAGQHSSFLNISGGQDVTKAVLRCWASLFEARAIYYRAQNKFNHLKVGIAVCVQSMIQAEKAGILFTIDPVSNNKETVVIEAGFGLGEAVVSGSISPDKYIVNKNDFSIISKEINRQNWKITQIKGKDGKERTAHQTIPLGKQKVQKLTDEEIVELAKLGKKIEDYYNAPQDTEWAIESSNIKPRGSKIWFVQSRPITTLAKKLPISETDQGPVKQTKEDIILRGAGASLGWAYGTVKIIANKNQLDEIKDGDVLVAEMTTPDYVPAMKRARAIVTDVGGRTCHAAIVSRELGIPAVVGTGSASHDLKNGQIITVDGANGLVYKGKTTLDKKINSIGDTKDQIKCRQTIPITGTKIYVNLAEVELAEKVASEPVDGVGLLRAEFMIAAIGEHPKALLERRRGQYFIDKLAENLKKFTGAFNPRPVVYRATDFKTNEYRNLKGGEKFEPREENPMIGYRGCFRYIEDPEVFKLELAAIKKVRDQFDGKNLHLMIPFVRTVDEMAQTMEIIKNEGLIQSNNFKIWMMCEVPSNVILLEKFLDLGIDGISIGSNDLTQLILGCDRDSQILGEAFDERNEAVVKSIEYVVKTCRKRGVTCSICGQAPSVYPEYSQMLVEAGVTSISVNPDMIIPTRRLVASIEKKVLLDKRIK